MRRSVRHTFSIDDFLDRSIPEPNTGCWLWMGATVKPNSYGCVRYRNRNLLAHRLSYELHIGPIPESLFVCHKCNVKACCNPAHLYLATNGQNIRDAYRDGLIVTQNAKKQVCPRCFSNFKIAKDGKRFCGRCRVRNNTMHKSIKRALIRAAIDAARKGE